MQFDGYAHVRNQYNSEESTETNLLCDAAQLTYSTYLLW